MRSTPFRHQLATTLSILSILTAAATTASSAFSFGSSSNNYPMSSIFNPIPASTLFVSEPDPRMFGNPANPAPGSDAAKTWTNQNWLKSRFHFSFAEYHSRERSSFGALRVLNDDLVQPRRMFGTHGHQDAEIFTYVVRGFLTHKDSMGNEETLTRGAVQYLSAGTGIRHSEGNSSPDKDLRFLQIWITPRKRGVTPRYGSYASKGEETLQRRTNAFEHILGDIEAKGDDAPIKIHQDVNVFVVERLEKGKEVSLPIASGRAAYAVCVEGAVTSKFQDKTLEMKEHDALAVAASPQETNAKLSFTAMGDAGAHLLVLELRHPSSGGSRVADL